MWPRVGFWAARDVDGYVTPCMAPAKERCTGWNVTIGATLCGVGYLQGSFLCSACEPSYYLQDDATCASCPVLTSAWDRYRSLMYILIVLLGIVALVWAGLWTLVRMRGGTLAGGAVRMVQLGVWGFMAAQVVASAAAVTSTTLPPMITALYRILVVLQLQNVLLPPACTGDYPFFNSVLLMSAALCAWGIAVATFYLRPYVRALSGNKSNSCVAIELCGRCALVLTLVLFSSVSCTAVDLLTCSSVSMAINGAAELDGGPRLSSAMISRGAVVNIRVLSSNKFFVCWAGSHRPAGVLAAVIVVLYVVLMPLVTLVWVWRDPWLRFPRQVAGAGVRGACGGCSCKPRDDNGTHAHGRQLAEQEFLRSSCCHRIRSHGRKELVASHTVRVAPNAPAHLGASTVNNAVGIVLNPLHALHALAANAPRENLPYSAPPSFTEENDILLDPFLGDYEPHGWNTKHIDLALLLLLSLLRALLPRPATLEGIVSKAAVSVVCILAVCAHVLLVRPFRTDQAWKGWVRAALLVDSAGCVLLNAVVAASDLELGGAALTRSITVGSYALLVACLMTFVVLLVGFIASMYKGEWVKRSPQHVARVLRHAAH
jgi:hypothetical protein